MIYRLVFQHVFRRIDPERAHELAYALIRVVGVTPGLSTGIRRAVAPFLDDPRGPASVRTLGQTFPAPFGLAGGFDKNGAAVRGLSMLGFGFVEIGTVTARPQPGNRRPRLWRLLEEQGLRNRMGFNNEGAATVARRLRRLRSTPRGRSILVGVNIGKTKVVPEAQAAEDYAASASLLAPFADYLVVNVSSPNTPGLRDLQSAERLRPLLRAVRDAADAASPARRVPLLVKIAPDLADGDVDEVADLVAELSLDGVVAVNTTIAHDLGEGGVSGPRLRERGLQVVARLRERLGPDVALIGCGGVQDADDAEAYRRAGADLVQGYTGLIYHGPFWGASVNRGLIRRSRSGEAAR